jgi:hypothetical protein
MIKHRRLTPAQRNLLEWGAAWCALMIPILTCAVLAYLSIMQAAWWSRAIFVVLLIVELGLYFLWGMISMGHIAPRTILVFLCKPIRHVAYLLLRHTRAYASEEEVFTLFVCILPASSEAPESEVH